MERANFKLHVGLIIFFKKQIRVEEKQNKMSFALVVSKSQL